jgi:hypothetical protein
MGWLPRGFEHPVLVAVPGGYHLRPINADDVDLDYPAVMGSPIAGDRHRDGGPAVHGLGREPGRKLTLEKPLQPGPPGQAGSLAVTTSGPAPASRQ